MRLRWYNPTLQEHEWRDLPESEEEAQRLLATLDSPRAEEYLRVYGEWRRLGASVTVSLMRVSEAAQGLDVRRSPQNDS